jgi:hypothetical protein
MRQEVIAILHGAARKLLLTRAAEAAAVVATAAGLSAAALEAAWALAKPAPAVAAILCALAVAAGVSIVAFPAIPRSLRVERRLGLLASGFCVIAGAAGAMAVITGSYAHLSKSALPLILLPAGALVGFAAVVARGVSLREAAIYLDVRCKFGERLSTAAELSSSDHADGPLARCVYSQALDAVRAHPPRALAMWKRSRATAGALGLAALLAATLTFLPGGRPGEAGSLAVRLAESLETMTPAQRKELSDAFRAAAQGARGDPELAGKLEQAAKVIEVKDAEKLKEVIRALEKAGFAPVSVVPQDLQAVLGLSGAGEGAGGNGGTNPLLASRNGGGGNGGAPTTRHTNGTDTQPGESYVSVYDPQYANLMAGRPATGESAKVAPAEAVPYQDAWSAARRSAAENLARGRTPPQYRQLVRDFFGIEE